MRIVRRTPGAAIAIGARTPCFLSALPDSGWATLAVVAVDRDRLHAEFPGIEVDLRNLVHGRRLQERFTVFEIAPEMNGWIAPIILT